MYGTVDSLTLPALRRLVIDFRTQDMASLHLSHGRRAQSFQSNFPVEDPVHAVLFVDFVERFPSLFTVTRINFNLSPRGRSWQSGANNTERLDPVIESLPNQ